MPAPDHGQAGATRRVEQAGKVAPSTRSHLSVVKPGLDLGIHLSAHICYGHRMSRSFRKTPIIGITTARSEKQDKAKAHRRDRQAVKSVLKAAIADEPENAVQGREHPRSGQWNFAKDGKRWVGNRFPKEMRK